MAEKFRNRYRSKTIRLPGYDYSSNGAYFVTICIRKKIQYLGTIINGKLILSDSGIIVQKCWLEIPSHFSNTSLDDFVIMPDHMHGIIIINSNLNSSPETPKLVVSTSCVTGNPYWKPNSLGSIINQFKRICTIETKSIGSEISWQPRYYDHIIRSDNELYRVRSYITNNPGTWLIDDYG